MSIKKLFESTDTSRTYLSDTTEKDLFKDVESAKNAAAIATKQQRFVPQVDYSEPINFAKYGSARIYYQSAINRILDYYPYDGSEYEITEFHNKSLDIEEFVFDNLYPRTTGYALLSANGWGALLGGLSGGYGTPSVDGAYDYEYIEFTGGPHAIGIVGESSASAGVVVSGSTTAAIFPDDSTSKRTYSNVYDTDIYTNAGLESDYGTGSRGSNLECNFDKGVTIEFWLKKDAFDTSKTRKEVIFDIWNGADANTHNFGRVLLSMRGNSSPPFILTVNSGSTKITEQALGSGELTVGTLTNSSWKHYAVTMKNSGSNFVTKLYVTGTLDSTTTTASKTFGTLPSKTSASGAMGGRIGALIFPTAVEAGEPTAGQGKLSASIDEFRFWKVARNSDEIGKHWFTQVRGGTNTDISNTTLGLYYKFNEGITGTASLDNNVLDYSGRISNGNWIGYDSTIHNQAVRGTYGRSTGSAIVESTASATEYKDPIIRSNHTDVISLKKDLESKGEEHDHNNNSAFKSLIPSWAVEAQEASDGKDFVPVYDNNIEMVSHVVGTYFDKLRLQIKALPTFKQLNYTSASYKPLPFAQHLPQSLGLYMPELFIDSTVLERFRNRTPSMKFEGDLTETKNLIYLNIYNNLANIYKSKGAEKSIRNIFRCFHLDDKLVRLNVYANNETFELKDNLKQTLINKRVLNFNTASNTTAVVYQAKDSGNGDSLGYISGSNGVGVKNADGVARGYEFPYGFTTEADVIFPTSGDNVTFNKGYTEVSLFGMHSASTDDDGTRALNDTTWFPNDAVSFQVYAIKESIDSKNVYFKLTSSLTPKTSTGDNSTAYALSPSEDLSEPFVGLTSSYFYDVYDNTRWNISVRLKPSSFGVTDMVTGSAASGYRYDLVFKGLNSDFGTVQNSFTLTASISKTAGHNLLKSAKRLYVGGRRHNITGAVSASSDVLFVGTKYWAKYVDDLTLTQHAYDLDNAGISGSWRNVSALDMNLSGSGSVLNSNMLALDWRFNDVTSSDANGGFYVTDFSSGSALLTQSYGWVGGVAGYQHVGSGSFFGASKQNVIASQSINAFQFINPEYAVSSDMVKIMSDDDKYFGIFETPPNYRYVLEKSMYNAISEEMLDFFAGAIDFHNIIGEPINRYRGRYKRLEKLREIFFRRVTAGSGSNNDGVTDVEKFIDYYKWFDDAIAEVIGQLLPASVDFTPDSYNTIESHVLERNKYRTKYPTIKYEDVDPAAAATSGESTWGSTEPSSPRKTNMAAYFWKCEADRASPEITSNNSTIDSQRNNIRNVVCSEPTYPETLPMLTDASGSEYKARSVSRRSSFVKISGKIGRQRASSPSTVHGGVNFGGNKNIHFTYNALYPAGPVNRDGSVFVPLNVLYAETDDLVPLDEIVANISKAMPNRKLKRIFSTVQHGRDWEEGYGYANTKSTFSFPFNIMSSSVVSGYNKAVSDKVLANLEVVNLHNDAYGEDMEIPMQGTFTSYHVGGHQSRHVP